MKAIRLNGRTETVFNCLLCGSDPELCAHIRKDHCYYIKCTNCFGHTNCYNKQIDAIREWNGDFASISEEGIK